jgi:AcrR family transcriptional regulator
MPPATAPLPRRTAVARPRLTAAERREAVLEAAVVEFAGTGLFGTSAEAIARRAGVSQPYLFRLFGTKKKLYLACVHRNFDQVRHLFETAAAGSRTPFEAMGQAYVTLLADRVALLCQMQAYAACGDTHVQEVVRVRYGELYAWLRTLPGGSEETVRNFLATGMLLNVVAAMDLPAIVAGEALFAGHLRALSART